MSWKPQWTSFEWNTLIHHNISVFHRRRGCQVEDRSCVMMSKQVLLHVMSWETVDSETRAACFGWLAWFTGPSAQYGDTSRTHKATHAPAYCKVGFTGCAQELTWLHFSSDICDPSKSIQRCSCCQSQICSHRWFRICFHFGVYSQPFPRRAFCSSGRYFQM